MMRREIRHRKPTPRLERVARAIAKAEGYEFTGESIVADSGHPTSHGARAHRFVKAARAAIEAYEHSY